MHAWSVILLGLCSCIAYANPVSTVHEKRDDRYDELYKEAEEFFPGIWWYSAKRTCTLEQFTALYDATANAVGLVDMVNKNEDIPDLGLSSGWNKFFMDGKIWQAQYPEDLSAMLGLYNQTRDFIKNGGTGPKKGKRVNRLAYVCGDDNGYNTCKNSPNTRAYVPTQPNKLENCPNCWVVSFCDPFFKLSSILHIVSKGHWLEKDLNDPRLVSQEHAVFHEWMHADLMGQKDHITDLKGQEVYNDGFKRDIYGATLCSDFAWKYANEVKVNHDIRLNADNYAWVLSYTYYDKSYGWGIGNMINQRITVAETEGGAKRSPTENS